MAIWLAPVLLAVAALGQHHVLSELGLFFSQLALLSFGGAYAVLAWLSDEAVARGWLTASEMVDGLGLAETTPGPTILVNQFAGFLAAWRSPAPFSPPVAAMLGAAMTVWVTFAPSFLWIFAGGPFFEAVRRNRMLRGALLAITAAVCGIIATLALRFGLAVLFAGSTSMDLGAFSLPLPDWRTLRWDAAALTLIAGGMLFWLHRGVIETVAALAIIGMLWRLAF
jgi:chromate transporter